MCMGLPKANTKDPCNATSSLVPRHPGRGCLTCLLYRFYDARLKRGGGGGGGGGNLIVAAVVVGSSLVQRYIELQT